MVLAICTNPGDKIHLTMRSSWDDDTGQGWYQVKKVVFEGAGLRARVAIAGGLGPGLLSRERFVTWALIHATVMNIGWALGR